ncbi:hypothetical protein H4R33_002080 [Dimargaris cristalligena]|uniref:Uncharacterized protein n=1 Tax=Dimargaris cristalligena TaxID=215637 RepID=A0A4Q0A190_9FUNG|nr:hypothetical protein H4R33_002080 [Dimargaris cristalligena]RKP39052.1 hypothetical protein BJ085DRAFT_28783 [Dimargaris cristalligena]|eukprot:RKP39052.1 hypothetical protein BJ085DRAFT_28783 [Dimargaris cristalligena]
MDRMNDRLAQSVGRSDFPDGDDILPAVFRQAAMSVTELYKKALTQNRRAYRAGYEQCLEDFGGFLAEFIASSSSATPAGSGSNMVGDEATIPVTWDQVVRFVSYKQQQLEQYAPPEETPSSAPHTDNHQHQHPQYQHQHQHQHHPQHHQGNGNTMGHLGPHGNGSGGGGGSGTGGRDNNGLGTTSVAGPSTQAFQSVPMAFRNSSHSHHSQQPQPHQLSSISLGGTPSTAAMASISGPPLPSPAVSTVPSLAPALVTSTSTTATTAPSSSGMWSTTSMPTLATFTSPLAHSFNHHHNHSHHSGADFRINDPFAMDSESNGGMDTPISPGSLKRRLLVNGQSTAPTGWGQYLADPPNKRNRGHQPDDDDDDDL